MVLRQAIIAIIISVVLAGSVHAVEPILGFYAYADKASVDTVSESPFNHLITYGTDGKERPYLDDFLGHAAKKRVKVVFSLKDCFKGSKWYPKTGWCSSEDDTELVACIARSYGKHDAIAGWYLADEPTDSVGGYDKKRRLANHAGALKKFSPKPVFVEDYALPRGKLWDELTTYSDVLLTNAYPVPDKSLSEIHDAIYGLTSKYGNKVVAVVQAHGKYQYDFYKRNEINGRSPTPEEIRAMSYLALLAGARGIIYYSLFDLKKQPDFAQKWPLLKKLGQDILTDYPLISSPEKPKTAYSTKVATGVYTAIRSLKNRVYLVCVNSTRDRKGLSVTGGGETRNVELSPLEVRIVLLTREIKGK